MLRRNAELQRNAELHRNAELCRNADNAEVKRHPHHTAICPNCASLAIAKAGPDTVQIQRKRVTLSASPKL